ncbi:MAG: baseplate J/gp47 family protein, partial [Oscillospiraceae bacterium]|nr:baseplate J/gp47 family protein [Oscillospiraceae bacterium]
MEEITAIYQRMRETFARRAGFEPSENCDAMVRLYALSAQLQALLTQADWVLEQSFPQTAKGAYLDYHAQTRALERRNATCATGALRFFAGANAPADYEIPVNTVCMNEAGSRFATISPAVLRAGEPYVDVPARAMEPGEAGNAIAG